MFFYINLGRESVLEEMHEILGELEFRYQEDNIYIQTINTILHAADLLKIPKRLKLIMAQPKREIMTHFPVLMDSGDYKLFKGYRVQHNDVLGPYKGGLRYDPQSCRRKKC